MVSTTPFNPFRIQSRRRRHHRKRRGRNRQRLYLWRRGFLLLSVCNYDASIQNTSPPCTIVTHKDFSCRSARGSKRHPPFLLNFVRYPPPRRSLHDVRQKKIQTYAIIGESIFFSREKSKFSRVISFERTIKNGKLRDRPRSLFYTLFKFALLIKKFKAHSFLQFIRPTRANRPLFQEEWVQRSFAFPADTLLNTSFYYAITGGWISLSLSFCLRLAIPKLSISLPLSSPPSIRSFLITVTIIINAEIQRPNGI